MRGVLVGVGLGWVVKPQKQRVAGVFTDQLQQLLLEVGVQRVACGVAEPHFIALVLEKRGLEVGVEDVFARAWE